MPTDIVTRRWAGRPRNRGSILDRNKRIFFPLNDHNSLEIQPEFYSAGKRDTFSGVKAADSEAGSSPALSDGAKYGQSDNPVPRALSCHAKKTLTSFVIYFVENKTLLLGNNYTGS